MRGYPALRVTPPTPSVDAIDLVAAALDDYGVLAIEEVDDGAAIVAYLADAALRPAAADALANAFPGSQIETLDVPDENWAERSQAMLRAVKVRVVTVTPPWDVPADEASTIVVILPSMGFGTGHHATTRLCVEELQDVEPAGKSVLDVGTGSGVLAITASLLGAARVVAVDNDQDAIDNAAENARLNRTSLDLRCVSIEEPEVAEAGPFDVVLANLTGAALERFSAALASLTTSQGVLIVSGLRVEEEGTVRKAFDGFDVGSRREEDGWICLVLRRTQA